MLLLSLFSRIKKNEPFVDATEAKYSLHNERVTLEQVMHSVLVESFNDNQDDAVISKGTAHSHDTILKQRVHERRVLCPVGLFPAGFACYPVGSRSKGSHKRLFQAIRAFHLMVMARSHAALP